MRQSYFLKKRFSAFGKAFVAYVVKISCRFYGLIFAKRTILFVTNEKISSITLGPILQAGLLVLFAWVGNLFVQSLHYDEMISAKSDEIKKLKSVNEYFSEEFDNVNDKLKKINEYFISITGNKHSVKAQENNFIAPKNFKTDDLSKHDKETLNQVKTADFQLASIQAVAQSRIKKIEEAITLTGLNIKKSPKLLKKQLNEIKEVSLNGNSLGNQGGPLVSNDLDRAVNAALKSESNLERNLQKVKFTSEIDYLIILERLAEIMPFSRPMKNYYISSGFGSRADPITHKTAKHQGLDFVGSSKAKIISPSKGVVILAGKFSEYGNAVVIDHGFGITTRYGHLAEVKVKTGQVVEKGDLLALQGSTGRSTGDHLHYEVRYKNTPLNPKKFLEAGESLFNDEKSHVNS